MGHKKEARSVLLSGWSGCRAVSAAVRPLCAVGLSGSCQAVTLGPDSDGAPRLSDSAVRLSDTCCQTVRESAVSAVRLSGTVRRCPGFAVRLSDQGSGKPAYHKPAQLVARRQPAQYALGILYSLARLSETACRAGADRLGRDGPPQYLPLRCLSALQSRRRRQARMARCSMAACSVRLGQ
jgi:hypothetical protein